MLLINLGMGQTVGDNVVIGRLSRVRLHRGGLCWWLCLWLCWWSGDSSLRTADSLRGGGVAQLSGLLIKHLKLK